MTEALLPIVQKINGYLSDYILVALLIAVGLWYSIKPRFVQVRHFKEGWTSVFGSLSLRGGKQESGMSSFQALATAIAAQVGTGYIVGAAGAILTRGPGAIFWMWVIAFLGMATIYAEATLAQETRTVDKDGNVLGGPVYYITTAFKGGFGKFLAGFFAVAIILALGFFGCMVQSNSIGETFSNAFNVPTWIIGGVLVASCGCIFLGGVQRLASVTEKIVPIMAAVFLAGGLLVLIARIKYVPATFGMIFRYAFAPQAIIGGGFGAALVAQHAALCLGDGQRSVGKSGAAFAQGGKVLQHGADARFPTFPIEKGTVERVLVALHADLVAIVDAGDARQRIDHRIGQRHQAAAVFILSPKPGWMRSGPGRHRIFRQR